MPVQAGQTHLSSCGVREECVQLSRSELGRLGGQAPQHSGPANRCREQEGIGPAQAHVRAPLQAFGHFIKLASPALAMDPMMKQSLHDCVGSHIQAIEICERVHHAERMHDRLGSVRDFLTSTACTSCRCAAWDAGGQQVARCLLHSIRSLRPGCHEAVWSP